MIFAHKMSYPKIKFPGFGQVYSPEENENRLMGLEDRFLMNAKCRAVAMAKFMGAQIRRWHKRHLEEKGYEVKETDLLYYIKEGKFNYKYEVVASNLSNNYSRIIIDRIFSSKDTQEKAD